MRISIHFLIHSLFIQFKIYLIHLLNINYRFTVLNSVARQHSSVDEILCQEIAISVFHCLLMCFTCTFICIVVNISHVTKNLWLELDYGRLANLRILVSMTCIVRNVAIVMKFKRALSYWKYSHNKSLKLVS